MINCDQIAVESARLKSMFEKCYNLKAIDLRSIVDLVESVSACAGGSFNIKTVNGQSLLGIGNISITANVDGTETKVQQGAGIVVSGTGSLSNPYVITNSSLNNVDGSETKINQGSNIIIAGTGTSSNPYVINANIPSAAIQVNSDWGSISGPSQILNKPEIPTPLAYIPENESLKQNDLSKDGTGAMYPTVDAISSGTSYKRTIAQIRALSGELPNNDFYVTDLGKEGNWYYDPKDVVSLDNTGTVLVTTDGKRIKRSFLNNELNISWFITNELAKYYSSGISITTGTNILDVVGANFNDSYIGSKVRMYAGGIGGTYLIATIITINSPTQVLLSINSSLTLVNQKGLIGGFDETERFQTVIDILNSEGGKLIIPQGRYYIDGTVYIKPVHMSVPIAIEGQNDMVLQDAWATSAYGVSLLKNTPGDVFRVNMDETGLAIITYPGQYVGFSAKNISFIGDDVTAGVVAFNIFRTRSNIQNISGHRIDYIVKQLATDIAGINPTYCDMSLYKNIRAQQSKLGGLMLRYADNSTISELYFEGGDTDSKHMLEIYNTSSIFGYNFLHGVMNNEQKTLNSALVRLEQVFGAVFIGLHSESCNFENIYYIVNSGAINISGVQTTLERNNAFKLSAVKGLTIDTWYDYTDISAGSYDIDFGTNSSNRDVNWNNISSFNVAQVPGVSRRSLVLNNESFRGLTYFESPVEYVSDMNNINGNKQFRSNSGCLNLPAGLSNFSGTQYLMADNNSFRVQSGMGGDFVYTRYMSNGVWNNWNRLLNFTDLNNTVLTGIPIAPTAASNTNTTQIATTANVVSTINNRINGTSGFVPSFNGVNSLGDSIIRNSTTGIGIGGGVNSLSRIRLTTDIAHRYGLLLDTSFSQPSSSAVFLIPSFNSAVTTKAEIFRASYATSAEAFTLPDLRLYSAENGSIGAGSSITDLTGFYVNQLTGAANNYGFRGLVTSAANRWNLYMDGTAKNYLLGNTMIGSNVDNGSKLQVTGNASITGSTTVGGDVTVLTNINSSSSNLVVSDTNGVIFRGTRANSWSDNLSSRFFQIGTAGDNVVFSTQSANNANRMMFASNATQFSSGNYLTTPAPLGIFEITNGVSRVLNAFSNGNISFGTQPVTSATTYDFITRNISTGIIEKIPSANLATIVSPAFTGTPTAPTATLGTSTTQIATTAFVQGSFLSLTGNQTATGRKTFASDNTTVGGVNIFNSRTVNSNGTSDAVGIYINTSGQAGIGIEATANNGISAKSFTGATAIAIESWGNGNALTLRTVSGTGDLLNAESGVTRIQSTGRLSTTLAPTVGDDVTNKTYVDNAVAGNVNIAGFQEITGLKSFRPVANATGVQVVPTSGNGPAFLADLVSNSTDYAGFLANNNGTGFNYVGQNNGVNTFIVDKFGVVTATGGTANNHLATLGQLKSKTGWANYSTTAYTSASPFSIAPTSTVTLVNNANNSITTDLPLGVTSFYNGITNKITPASIGDAYTVNIRFKAKTTTNNDYLTLYIDIGSGDQINAETKQFLKGANTEQSFNFTLPIFALATFVTNGGLVKITSGAGTISVYDITYFITRNHTR